MTTNRKTFTKRQKVVTFAALALLLIVAAVAAISGGNEADKWQEWQTKHVSIIDGACRPLEKHIKSTLNDAGSYEHVSTDYYLNADSSIVTAVARIRSANQYGAKTLQTYRAELSLSGNIISIQVAN